MRPDTCHNPASPGFALRIFTASRRVPQELTRVNQKSWSKQHNYGHLAAPGKLSVVTFLENSYDPGCMLVTCNESLVESKVPVIVTFWPA